MTPNPAAAAIAREDFALHALPIELINAAVAAYRLLAAAFPNKVASRYRCQACCGMLPGASWMIVRSVVSPYVTPLRRLLVDG